MRRIILVLIILQLLSPIEGQEKRYWQLEYMPGVSYVPPMPLSFHQQGQPAIEMIAHYKTRSLEMPLYYSYRFSTWRDKRGWSIEMNHLKIYLKNTTPDVEDFSVSHGYNHLFINRHFIKKHYLFIIGGGIVLGHPESIVRGQMWTEKGGLFNWGYYLAGISAQGAINFPVINTSHFTIPIESKFTIGYGHVPIVNGHARVPIISISLLAGLGLKL